MSEQPSAIADEINQLDMPFSGSPKKYLKICVLFSFGFHAYLFFGYGAIKVFLAQEPWPNGWLWSVVALISASWFAWYSYGWIMRLDARFGKGSGWVQESVTVKLPWEKAPKH